MTLPILFIIAALLLLLGVIAILVVILVAKGCRCRTNSQKTYGKTLENDTDPWREAGKRVKTDYDEPK